MQTSECDDMVAACVLNVLTNHAAATHHIIFCFLFLKNSCQPFGFTVGLLASCYKFSLSFFIFCVL